MIKVTKLILAFGIMVFMAHFGFAQNIAGSAHDFSTETWNPGGEICQVCHTPHNAVTGLTAPLWNHEVTLSTFTLYTNVISPSFDAVTAQPDGASKLCLSCHDGTIALDNFGGQTGGTNFLTGSSLLDTDLSNDHPLSFTYDPALASLDGGLHDPTTTNSGLGGTIDTDLLLGGKIQCSSCHDVHNSYGNTSLLVKDNSGSALCLTCHDK